MIITVSRLYCHTKYTYLKVIRLPSVLSLLFWHLPPTPDQMINILCDNHDDGVYRLPQNDRHFRFKAKE